MGNIRSTATPAYRSKKLDSDIIRQGKFQAHRISDDLSWGMGSIGPGKKFSADEHQLALIKIVLERLEEVDAAEMSYSSCTDGRVPVRLLDDNKVPVREQNVGADTMLFFHMAEALGRRFYKNPDAPLVERIKEVVAFMKDNGLQPSTHISCGAAANYVPINRNLAEFTSDSRFVERQRVLLPDGAYNESVRDKLTKGYQDRLSRGVYDNWSDQLVVDAVRGISGDHAVAELNDDGRGVHGHVEEQIIRIKIDGIAINEAKVVSRTNGREVFGVNDLRLERLARLLGHGQDEDYTTALMAAEDFTDGGHGTLAKGLPTYVIESA